MIIREAQGTKQYDLPDDASNAEISSFLGGKAWVRVTPLPKAQGQTVANPVDLRKAMISALPMAGAAGMAMLAPEAEVAAPFLTRLLPLAAQRVGLAGAGGMLGKGVQQAVNGQPLDPRQMVSEGGRQMAMAAPGEALATGAAEMAPALSRFAWRMSPTAQEAAGANMTKAAQELYPEGEKLWVSALKEGVPPNPGVIRAQAKGVAKAKDVALANNVASGQTFNAFDVINRAGIPELRKRLSMMKDAQPALDELDSRIAAFVSQRRLPGAKPNQIGPLKRFNAQELQDELRVWQDEAQKVYDKVARTGDAPLTQELDRAIPAGGRRTLEDAIPQLAPLNARLQRLGRLEENAANVNRKGTTFMPLLAGMGGSLYGSDPTERVKNAVTSAVIMRALTSPTGQGWASLLMASPQFQGLLREGSRFGVNSLFPEPDSTR